MGIGFVKPVDPYREPASAALKAAFKAKYMKNKY